MPSTSKSSEKSKIEDWGSHPSLTPEQIIEWLEGHRQLMIEIWKSNPGSREQWEKTNLARPAET